MSGERVLAALGPVVELFEQLEIPYHIGGSVATSVFGSARSTLEVDMVAAVELHHAGRIATALRGTYYADGSARRAGRRAAAAGACADDTAGGRGPDTFPPRIGIGPSGERAPREPG